MFIPKKNMACVVDHLVVVLPQKMSKSVAGNPLSHVWIQPKDPKGRSQSVYVRRLPSQ